MGTTEFQWERVGSYGSFAGLRKSCLTARGEHAGRPVPARSPYGSGLSRVSGQSGSRAPARPDPSQVGSGVRSLPRTESLVYPHRRMPGPQSPHPIPDATSTAELITRVQRGDDEAYARLMHSFAPLLRRWAHVRVSDRARGAVETEDLVQETLLAVHRKMDTIEAAHPGAFWLYLRRTIQRPPRPTCWSPRSSS